MKTRIYDNGGYIYIDTENVKGWHHCEDKEFFANLDAYGGELDDNKLKWIGAKIDRDLIMSVLALIKHYPTTEVMICLYYNTAEKKWLAHVPKQKGSPAHVSYSDEEYKEPEGYVFLGTIHTHPNMGAFWSGTDTNDQGLKNGVHIVIGTKDGYLNTYKCSLFFNKKQYDQEDAVDMPSVEEAKNLPEANEEWLKLVEVEYEIPKPSYSLVSDSVSTYKEYGYPDIDDMYSAYDNQKRYKDFYEWYTRHPDYSVDGSKIEDPDKLEQDTQDLILDVEEALIDFPDDTVYALVQDLLMTLGEHDIAQKVGEVRLQRKEDSNALYY